MGAYAGRLSNLAGELLSVQEQEKLLRLAASPALTYATLALFDDDLGGPSFGRLHVHNACVADVVDRDVFRPLQYCAMYFSQGCRELTFRLKGNLS